MKLIDRKLYPDTKVTIAVLGATSQIAKDLIREWSKGHRPFILHLYARNTTSVGLFIHELDSDLVIKIININDFKETTTAYDAVVNFVGVGDPSKAQLMASTIQDVTFYYDDLVIKYLKDNHKCKYIFLSSGAAYGSDYSEPASLDKKACFDINNVQQSEKYGVAKFITEMKHRQLQKYNIYDVRVFNYISRHQNIDARFFITDLFRSIKENVVCEVSPEPMVRDYLHPRDFCRIIDCLIYSDSVNMAFDCYSLDPVGKIPLLNALQDEFGLQWKFRDNIQIVSATGNKCNYYSKNHALANIGYVPAYTSLSGIIKEFDALLRC